MLVIQHLGPYALSQAHLASRAAGWDARAPWRAWASALDLASPTWEPLSAGEVSTIFADDLDLPDFYSEWAGNGAVGLPILGLESVLDDSGDAVARVVQVQVDGLGWPLYHDVPWLLGCQGEANSDAAFAECGVTGLGHVPIPGTKGAASPELSSTRAADLLLTPTSGFPARFALFGNHLLVADAIGSYGLSDGVAPPDHRDTEPVAPTWQLRCASEVQGSCDPAVDADGDGAPDAADCAPDDPTRAPDRPDPALPLAPWLYDANCDGWPSQRCVLQAGAPSCDPGSFP